MQTLNEYIERAQRMRGHSFKVTAPALGFLLVVLIAPALAEEPETCHYGATIVKNVQGYTVRLEPTVPLGDTGRLFMCRAVVLSASGSQIFSADDWRIDIQEATGTDLNGDGSPEVVLESWSGGVHCCYTYWILSLGSPPRLLHMIKNNEPLTFADIDGDGNTEIEGADGAFNYFDGLCYACSPFPIVVLRLEAGVLRDVTAQVRPLDERQTFEFRRKLEHEGLASFLRADPGEDSLNHSKTKQAILTIVLDYLYSGQGERAWKALDEMWPPSDKERIKELILLHRRCGLLRYAGEGCTDEERKKARLN